MKGNQELAQRRIMALVGILIMAFSAHPLAVNLSLLGDPNVNTFVGGISLAGFLLGLAFAIGVFKKNSA